MEDPLPPRDGWALGIFLEDFGEGRLPTCPFERGDLSSQVESIEFLEVTLLGLLCAQGAKSDFIGAGWHSSDEGMQESLLLGDGFVPVHGARRIRNDHDLLGHDLIARLGACQARGEALERGRLGT